MAEKEYQRLTGARLRRRGLLTAFATRSSLWLGNDHVLCVDSTGYAEEYKRFYFRDIQAFTIRKTAGMNVRAAIYGFLTIVCALLALLISDISATVVMSIIGVPCALLLAVNLALGPMSVCHLRTAVQVEELPSLCRLRRARKVLNRLRPLIETAQGTLSREELDRNLANLPDTPPFITSQSSNPANAPLRPYRGKVHSILFWLLLADLPATLVNVVVESGWLEGVSLLLLVVTVGFAIAALVQQRRTDLPSAVRNIPIITLVCAGLFFFTSVAYGIYIAASNPQAAGNSLSSMDDPVVMAMTAISTTISVLLGLFGLIYLRRYRVASSPASMPPPAAEQPAA